MAVIKLLNALAEDDRQPTPEERTMMARYVGFGGFPQAVDQKYKDAYEKYGDVASSELPKQTQASLKGLRFGLKGYDTYREMRQYLTPEEFQAIRQAMIDAFYTTIGACRAIHSAVKAAGFNGGRMLETSAGTGNFIGTGSYDSVPHWTAIELDKTTGKILQYLYPEANVKIQGYQDVIIPPNFIDAAISNVPFSNDIHPYDPEYNKYDFNLHDYFFAKTVDRLRPGGVAALITGLLGGSIAAQCIVFLLVSAVLLACMWPFARRLARERARKGSTNFDRVIGMTARVTETIDNVSGEGAVKVDGKTWSAKSTSGEKIEAGALVQIDSIQGVKVYVSEV